MEVAKIAKNLLKVSKSVRYVTIANTNGKVIFSTHPKSVHSKLNKKESRASLAAAAKMWKTRRTLQRKLGPCKYVVAEYGKVKRITIPAGRNNIIYVTTSVAFDHNKIIRRARQMR